MTNLVRSRNFRILVMGTLVALVPAGIGATAVAVIVAAMEEMAAVAAAAAVADAGEVIKYQYPGIIYNGNE